MKLTEIGERAAKIAWRKWLREHGTNEMVWPFNAWQDDPALPRVFLGDYSDREVIRVVDICDLCQRIRTFWTDADVVCKQLEPLDSTGQACLCSFYSAKRLD